MQQTPRQTPWPPGCPGRRAGSPGGWAGTEPGGPSCEERLKFIGLFLILHSFQR